MAPEHSETFSKPEKRHELVLRLLVFTRKYLRVHRGWNSDRMLPQGKDPQDIVTDLLEKIVAGDRALNAGDELLPQIMGMIKSEISNLFASSSAKQVSFVGATDKQSNHEPVTMATPAAAAEVNDLFDLLLAHPVVAADTDLGMVVLAYKEGADGPSAVAKAIGLDVKKVYECQRNLAKIYPSIKNALRK